MATKSKPVELSIQTERKADRPSRDADDFGVGLGTYTPDSDNPDAPLMAGDVQILLEEIDHSLQTCRSISKIEEGVYSIGDEQTDLNSSLLFRLVFPIACFFGAIVVSLVIVIPVGLYGDSISHYVVFPIFCFLIPACAVVLYFLIYAIAHRDYSTRFDSLRSQMILEKYGCSMYEERVLSVRNIHLVVSVKTGEDVVLVKEAPLGSEGSAEEDIGKVGKMVKQFLKAGGWAPG